MKPQVCWTTTGLVKYERWGKVALQNIATCCSDFREFQHVPRTLRFLQEWCQEHGCCVDRETVLPTASDQAKARIDKIVQVLDPPVDMLLSAPCLGELSPADPTGAVIVPLRSPRQESVAHPNPLF